MRARSCCPRPRCSTSASPRSAGPPAYRTCSMGLLVRIIPCLDVDAGRVVKGTKFENLQDAGDPVELAALYDREGADEIVFYDITASHEQRNTATELARRAAEEVFIPYTIGGGVRTAHDMRAMLRAGAAVGRRVGGGGGGGRAGRGGRGGGGGATWRGGGGGEGVAGVNRNLLN